MSEDKRVSNSPWAREVNDANGSTGKIVVSRVRCRKIEFYPIYGIPNFAIEDVADELLISACGSLLLLTSRM